MLHKFKGWIASEMVVLLLTPSLSAVPVSLSEKKGCFSLWVLIVLNNLVIVKMLLL